MVKKKKNGESDNPEKNFLFFFMADEGKRKFQKGFFFFKKRSFDAFRFFFSNVTGHMYFFPLFFFPFNLSFYSLFLSLSPFYSTPRLFLFFYLSSRLVLSSFLPSFFFPIFFLSLSPFSLFFQKKKKR